MKARIGDYVLLTKWGDKHPTDPWRVDFLEDIVEYPPGSGSVRYVDRGGRSCRWRTATRITREQGRWIIANGPELERLRVHRSLLNLARIATRKKS